MTRRLEFEFEAAPHAVNRASLSKLMALGCTELNSRLPRPTLRGFPSVLQIEPTNACNLRCPLCPSGVRAFSRPVGMMDFGVYRDLLAEIGDSLSLIVLWNWGEPFLNPDIFRMIRLAKRHNIAVLASSNGQRISERSEVEELVASGLDTLAVALDGACQETYGKYRVGGDLDRVLNCLALLRETKKAKGSSTPLVNVRVVVTRNNEAELSEITDLALKFGADLITYRSASMPDCCGPGLDEKYAPSDATYRMYSYSDADYHRSKRDGFVCRRPWKRLTVNWDGTFVSCEHDFDNSVPYGKFPDDGSAVQIYNSGRARDFRARFLRNKNEFAFCAQCPYNDRVVADCTVGKEILTGP
ncbi:MAG: radical SAM protein [Armatimonadota bacterium]|nr:radical SAM protein [Armatimonadota bacterium]